MLKCADLKKKKTLGAESNIEGAELSIGRAEGHPKVYKLTPVACLETESLSEPVFVIPEAIGLIVVVRMCLTPSPSKNCVVNYPIKYILRNAT